MINAHLTGTGCCLPDHVLTNHDLESVVETSDEWIRRRTGICQRRIARDTEDETTARLGARAARRALAMAGVRPEEIDTIIVGTVTADRQFPSAACMVQKELGITDAAAYDVSAGCSGFIFALEAGVNSIKVNGAANVLVIGVERLSSILNWNDRNTCVLLGDGAGAVLLQSGQEPGGVLTTHLRSDGAKWDLLYAEYGNDSKPPIDDMGPAKPFFLKMEGNRLFKHAVNCLSKIAMTALEKNGLAIDDVALVVPHQANIRIIRAVAEKLDIGMDRFFVNLSKYGNTSSASIPIALDEAQRSGRIQPGDNVLLISFGAGLTWGSALIEWTCDRRA